MIFAKYDIGIFMSIYDLQNIYQEINISKKELGNYQQKNIIEMKRFIVCTCNVFIR